MSDAKIYINNEYYGNDSAVYTDMKVSFMRSIIRVEKKGCVPLSYVLRKNDRVDYMAILGGVLLIAPIVWLMKYRPVYHLEYKCTQAASSES
jgi:hypothetical protein